MRCMQIAPWMCNFLSIMVYILSFFASGSSSVHSCEVWLSVLLRSQWWRELRFRACSVGGSQSAGMGQWPSRKAEHQVRRLAFEWKTTRFWRNVKASWSSSNIIQHSLCPQLLTPMNFTNCSEPYSSSSLCKMTSGFCFPFDVLLTEFNNSNYISCPFVFLNIDKRSFFSCQLLLFLMFPFTNNSAEGLTSKSPLVSFLEQLLDWSRWSCILGRRNPKKRKGHLRTVDH